MRTASDTSCGLVLPDEARHWGESVLGIVLGRGVAMVEPSVPVEHIPASRFRPPFCPNPDCRDHHLRPEASFPYWREGFYRRRCDGRRVPRFRCLGCRKGFSARTFALTYRMRKPHLLLPVARWMTSGAALRPIGRAYNDEHPDLACHPSTVARIARRVGSQAILLLEELHRLAPDLEETVILDHLESFVGLQENALGLATPIGETTGWIYGARPAWHRQTTRTSRTTPRVGRSHHEVERSVAEVLTLLFAKLPPGSPLHLVSDGDRRYARAIGRHPRGTDVRHDVHVNPACRRKGEPRDPATRARDRALRRNDNYHTLVRHLEADHRRETIAFCRRGEALVERAAALIVWHNLAKPVSIRRNDRHTPGMLRGLTGRPWRWAEILSKRRFASHYRLDRTTRQVLERRLPDPRGIPWPDRVHMRAV